MIDNSITLNRNDRELIINFAKKIVKHGMAVPAIFFLEMVKYMSFIGSQLMVFFGPVITVFIRSQEYYKISLLLEDRKNIEFLMYNIEKIVSEDKKKEF